MKLNCKPGDLAMVVRVTHKEAEWILGRVVRCVRLEVLGGRAGWMLEEGVTHPETVFEWHWIADDCLRPIRDQDGEDEMLRIAGLPHEVAV